MWAVSPTEVLIQAACARCWCHVHGMLCVCRIPGQAVLQQWAHQLRCFTVLPDVTQPTLCSCWSTQQEWGKASLLYALGFPPPCSLAFFPLEKSFVRVWDSRGEGRAVAVPTCTQPRPIGAIRIEIFLFLGSHFSVSSHKPSCPHPPIQRAAK